MTLRMEPPQISHRRKLYKKQDTRVRVRAHFTEIHYVGLTFCAHRVFQV